MNSEKPTVTPGTSSEKPEPSNAVETDDNETPLSIEGEHRTPDDLGAELGRTCLEVVSGSVNKSTGDGIAHLRRPLDPGSGAGTAYRSDPAAVNRIHQQLFGQTASQVRPNEDGTFTDPDGHRHPFGHRSGDITTGVWFD